LIYPKASIKDVQVTKEAFSLKREHPTLQYMEFLNFFLLLCVVFALLDPDPIGIRIRVRNPAKNPAEK
jgi:hypothetical protein